MLLVVVEPDWANQEALLTAIRNSWVNGTMKMARSLEEAKWLALVGSSDVIVAMGRTESWCREAVSTVSEASGAPIVVIGELSKPAAADLLEMGADFFVDRDAGEELITATLLSVWRRYGAIAEEARARYLIADDLTLDVQTGVCNVDGMPVSLSTKERTLLAFLMTRSPQTVPVDELIRRVWRHNSVEHLNALRIQINRLRAKLTDGHCDRTFISSVRGEGYRFVLPVTRIANQGTALGDASGVQSLFGRAGSIRKMQANLLEAIAKDSGTESVGATMLQSLVQHRFCDAAVLSLVDHKADRLVIVAQAGMSETWQRAVHRGLPLSVAGYIGVQTVSSGSVQYLSLDDRTNALYPETARLLATEGFRSFLSIPLWEDISVWGQLGFLSKRPVVHPLQAVILEMSGELLSVLRAARTADAPVAPDMG